MTFENALKKIKTNFENVDASKLADMAVQVTLTDEDCGGTLYFKAVNGALEVEGYDYRDNDAVIDIERKAFNDILSGKITLDSAIEKGTATAKGNFEKLATLNDAITKKEPVKKKAVKKETAKKAPAKKAPAKKTAEKAVKSVKTEKVEAKPEVKTTPKAEPVKTEKTVKAAAKKTTVKKA